LGNIFQKKMRPTPKIIAQISRNSAQSGHTAVVFFYPCPLLLLLPPPQMSTYTTDVYTGSASVIRRTGQF
jgi:hypothetical protein